MMSNPIDQEAKQKDKTKQYWDTFYAALPSHEDANHITTEGNRTATTSIDNSNESADLEWIVPNSRELLDTILMSFPSSSSEPSYDADDRTQPDEMESVRDPTAVNVLEIGCGVSQLSLSLLRRLLLNIQEKTPTVHVQRLAYDFVSTDVSPVCIEHNRTRDAAFMASLHTADGSLCYKLLDVINEGLPPAPTQQYDIILDKGTLDTFLFRSKRTQKSSALHPPLLTPLLNNIHGWLRSGCGAKYIIISPRSKIKSIRDFRGFASVRRMTVGTGDGVLVNGNGQTSALSKSKAYLYVCIKDDSYKPGKDAPYHSARSTTEDESTCAKCAISFKTFRGKVDIRDQGEIVWARRWTNHCVHCKGFS